MTNLLLIAVVALLAIITVLLVRVMRGGLIADIDRAVRRLGDAAAHHAEVNAVLALTQHFKNDPALVQKLPGYSQQVLGAALLHRVNSLGHDLKEVQTHLSRKREEAAHHAGYPSLSASAENAVKKLEAQMAHLLAELEAANNAVQAFNRLRSAS